MKVRSLLAAAAAVTTLATGLLTTGANANTDQGVDVGGGSAGIIATVGNQSYFLRDLDRPDLVTYTVVRPSVVMGKNGGNKKSGPVNQRVGPVTAKVLPVTIKGNRFGTPFAEGTAAVTDVTIGTTKIGTISTYCRWDKDNGAVGHTIVTDVNGQQYRPAEDTAMPIPGVGTLYFNEQDTHFIPKKNPDGSFARDATGQVIYFQVLYVVGARLLLDTDRIGDTNFIDAKPILEVQLAFTSCDPLVLPTIGGLKLLSSAT